ncbi:hypothetical protein MNBD_NITROSPINAE05-1259, partial [hydrothermal vent metagenome]
MTPVENDISYGRRLAGFWLIACIFSTGCDSFKLPSPPPDLFYKFNVLPVGQGPAHLLTADLNRDGNADIVSANSKDSTLSILYGKGDGTFQEPLNIPVPMEPTFIAVADFNNDDIPDIVVNAKGANAFVTLMGKGKNKFRAPQKHPTGRVPLAVIVGDFNQDGKMDIAVTLTFAKVEIYLGNGNGFFKKGETYLTG